MSPVPARSEERWSGKQWAFLDAVARYVLLEGGVRSGKSRALVRKALLYVMDHPGASVLLCRYTQDALDAQLRPLFLDMAPPGLIGPWHAQEEFYECGESRIYVRALKGGETGARFAKFLGATYAAIFLDEGAEVPALYFEHLRPRVSQPGFPHVFAVCTNPVDTGHWIAQEWPDGEPQRPGHQRITVSIYDNAAHLDAAVIEDLEASYPPGHPLRARLLDGRRGPDLLGDPVFDLFVPGVHINPGLPFLPDLPLLVGIDFGRFAATFAQFTPDGRLHVLGESVSDQVLEEAVPAMLTTIGGLFPGAVCRVVCDPSGNAPNSARTRYTATDILRQHGLMPLTESSANRPEATLWFTAELSSYLLQTTEKGPRFQIHPRAQTTILALAAGYVWGEHEGASGLRLPKKTHPYSDLMDGLKYVLARWSGRVVPRVRPEDRLSPLQKLARDLQHERMARSSLPAGYGAGGHRPA